MGFFDWLFGNKEESQKVRKKVYVTNDLGRHALANIEEENLDGSTRQKNLKKCVKLSDSSEWLYFFHRQIRGMECVVASYEKELRNGDSTNVDIGIVGEVPQDIISEFHAAKGDRISLLLDQEEFSQTALENGKKGVGITLRMRITLNAYEDEVQHLVNKN